MRDKTRKRIALVSLASGLAGAFFVLSIGLWSAVRPLGDFFVGFLVVTTLCLACLGGYWRDAPELSVTVTLLVAGGHVLGDYLRTMVAIRLPPTQSRYYVLVVGLAVALGLVAHSLGGFATDKTAPVND